MNGAPWRLDAVEGDEMHDAPLAVVEAASRRVPHCMVVPLLDRRIELGT
jgi:hypothetical protein